MEKIEHGEEEQTQDDDSGEDEQDGNRPLQDDSDDPIVEIQEAFEDRAAQQDLLRHGNTRFRNRLFENPLWIYPRRGAH